MKNFFLIFTSKHNVEQQKFLHKFKFLNDEYKRDNVDTVLHCLSYTRICI